MAFIDTSYFFEVAEDGSEQRFRLFATGKPAEDGREDEEDADALFDGVAIDSPDGSQLCETLKIGGAAGMPEHRTVSCRHTYEKSGVLFTIKSPVVQRRTYHKTLFATYCVSPGTDEGTRAQIRRAIQQTLKGSVLVAAVGSPGQALPAFVEMVGQQLSERGMMIPGGLKLGLYTEKTCGPWKNLPPPKPKERGEESPPEPVVEITGSA